MQRTQPFLIPGGLSEDKRGKVKFFNDFIFQGVKRFYEVTHVSDEPRAFHGHMKEEKYVYITSGSILLCLVKLTKTDNPSKKSKVHTFVLSSKNPQIVYIPKGYANGFKTLEKNTSVIFFSTCTIAQSQKDDFRYPWNYWGENIWEKK
jgi:dTDP-4-dehydrorhamnose 3,5-epimerase-like enzyme